VVGGAEGNPFYLEEMIKMLIDARVIRLGEEFWSVDVSRLATVRVPPTLTEVLQARLDSLSGLERTVLQRASVVGRVFWDKALVALSEDLSVDDVIDAIGSLKRKELIFERRPPAFSATREYTFKHSLLHDVTYEILLKRNRVIYHAQVAAWLDSVSGERRTEYLAQISDHYERGARYSQAAAVLSEAARRALDLSALSEARSFFEHALELQYQIQKSGVDLIGLELGLSETYQQLGEYPLSQKHAETAASMATELQNDVLEAEALVQLGQVALLVGNYRDARSYFNGALYLAEKENVPATLARALVALGTAEWRLGELEAARDHCLHSLKVAEKVGDISTRILALNRLGVVSGSQGAKQEAEQYCQQSLELALAVGNRERASTALNNLGAQSGEQKDWQKAWDYYSRAYSLAQETGSQYGNSLYSINLAMVGANLGKMKEARQFLRDGARLAVQIGASTIYVFAVIYKALLVFAEGDVERALELFGVAKNSLAYESECEREIAIYLDEWQLDPARVHAGLERGMRLDFNQVLNELLEA